MPKIMKEDMRANVEKATASRNTEQVVPASQPAYLGALEAERHTGRRATVITFQPVVRSHKVHKVTAKRTAMYVVFRWVLE